MTIRLQLLVLCLLSFCTCAYADVTGSILGVVTDNTGAVVANANVSLSNGASGFARKVVTRSDGSYEFLAVPADQGYSLTVEAPGFQRVDQTGIKLLVNQNWRADVRLSVGQVSTVVTVDAAQAQVETTSTEMGEVIESNKIESLPLNGRSYLDLLALQPGVVPANTQGNYTPVSGNLTAGQLSVNGGRENSNLFMVNGGNVEETGNNGASVIPVLESLQEFKVITNSFDAEYGQFSGAIVNTITKSGTDDFHATVFEFLRNTDLDARNYFAGTRGVFRRNQYGFAGGGPAWKNHIFFFSDLQWTGEAVGYASPLTHVPTIAERSGDFSDAVSAGYTPLTGTVRGNGLPTALAATLSARLGYTVTPGEPYWTPGCNSTAACVFPNQTIPQSAWSPAASHLIQYIPNPVGTSGGTPYWDTSGLSTFTNDHKIGERVDVRTQRFGDWMGYYHFDNASVASPFGSSNLPGFGTLTPTRAQQANIGNTKVLGSSMVNEARVNWTRFAYGGQIPTGGLAQISALGFETTGNGLIVPTSSTTGVPAISLNLLGENFGANVLAANPQNHIQVSDGFSWTKGKHTFKFGGMFGYSQWDERKHPNNGQFTFEGGETGNDFADLLLGAPDAFVQSSTQLLDSRSKSGAVYGQDSYRFGSNLVINYGVRWEFSQPWYDTKNRVQTFVPGQQSTVFADSPTGWLFPGDKGIPKTLAYTRWNDFAPRLGLAYSPSAADGFLGRVLGDRGTTSIHAAAGMFYTSFDTSGASYETGDAPFGYFYVSPVLVYLETPYQSRVNGDNPGQRFPFATPTGGNTSFNPFLPIAYSPAYSPSNKQPYSIDYNVSIQRQLTKSTVVTVAYVGTAGRHLFAQIPNNPGDPARCLQIANLYNQAGQPSAGCGENGEDEIYSISGQTFNGTRPYSVTSGRGLSQGELDFGNNTNESTVGISSFNSLQLTVNKAIGPLRLLGAYTMSKSTDDASGFFELENPYNLAASRGLSSFDVKNNFVVSYSYDLPLTAGLSSGSGFLYGLLSHWQFSGITRLYSGFPVTLNYSNDISLCGCGGLGTNATDLPNYNGQPLQYYNPRKNLNYFSTSQFSVPTLGTIGDANRRFFHGPGVDNTQVALVKTTRLTERVTMDLRAEFFNVFNHTQFENPGGSLGSSNFGLVGTAQDPRIGQVGAKLSF